MSRLSFGSVASSDDASSPTDLAFAQLSQLLTRLQHNVLHPTAERERRLRKSEYERARVESNLAYARTLLGNLEQEALEIKAPARRLERQHALVAHRDSLDTLIDRLEDLRQLGPDGVDDEGSDGEEDLLAHLEPPPPPRDDNDSRVSGTRNGSMADEMAPDSPASRLAAEEDPDVPTTTSVSTPTSTSASIPTTASKPRVDEIQLPTQTSQTLRSRAVNEASPPTSHSTARANLFANRRKAPASTQASAATAEAILDHQRAEQDSLSESILKMAGALKASSHRIATSLEEDKEVVNRAGEGMDRTEKGMEAASGRMGALRRMTEGKGWWGRMILYAWVYGLMLALVLLVFVMPKLRF
ncbi:hypothetical protein RJ55_04144 [Drechmeria coniospora]|nr:hypothetical protein RJ55_04144 [Drechmeria coniospora]